MVYLAERQFWLNSERETYLVSDYNGLPPPLDYYPNPFHSFGTCVYFVLISATTTGYGDVYPVAWQGRLFAATTAMTGILLNSLVIAILIKRTAPDDFQKRVMERMKRIQLKREMMVCAAHVIQTAWKTRQKSKRAISADPSLWERKIKSAIQPSLQSLRATKRKLRETVKALSVGAAKQDPLQGKIDTLTKLTRKLEQQVGGEESKI